MSSHRRRVKHFARTSGPRRALLRGLMVSLVEHERIKTTVDRAKEIKRHIEKAITLGKKGDLAARRLLLSRIANADAVGKIMADLSPRFDSRPGGYTRVIKIGRRPGDTAEMAFIEFIDFDYSKFVNDKKADSKQEKQTAEEKKTKAKNRKQIFANLAAHRKSVKKIQKASRAASR